MNNKRYVTCQVCRKKLGQISQSTHLKKHNMTTKQYKKLYPNSPLLPEYRRGSKCPLVKHYEDWLKNSTFEERQERTEGMHLGVKNKIKRVGYLIPKYKRRYGNKNPAKRLEVREKISRWKRKDGGNQAIKAVMSRTKESYIKCGKDTKDRMLKGQAAYMCSRNRNPSKPQVNLYNEIKKKYPTAELNHRLKIKEDKWFVLDIAIPKQKIDFEYNEPYWHNQKIEKDIERKNLLEEQGWVVIEIVPDAMEDFIKGLNR